MSPLVARVRTLHRICVVDSDITTEVTVQLDTGSADFCVYIPQTPPKLTNKTSVRVTESYGAGAASGYLSFTELKLGKYTVPNQGAQFSSIYGTRA